MKIDLNASVIKKTDYKIYTNILLSVLVILLIVIILYKMRHRIK